MSTALALMTIDEFLALPDDGVRRELIRSNALQELSAEPHLPGFRAAVAELFEG